MSSTKKKTKQDFLADVFLPNNIGFFILKGFGIIKLMNKNQYYQEIYNRFGCVTRARNCFLYTKKGIRLTDLYQENGRAILGWDGKSAFTFIKNTINRGQTGSFICQDKSRAEKAVSELFKSDRKVMYFYDQKDALLAGTFFSAESTSFYKPWLKESPDFSQVDSIIFAPPLPWTDSIFILAVKTDCINQLSSEKKLFAEQFINKSVKLPFAMECGITRALYNLIAELPLREEKNWFLYDPVLTKYWTRKGPYLYPKIEQKDYDAFILHCLDCELTISPDYNTPSIVPFGADRGVFTKLKNNPFEPKI